LTLPLAIIALVAAVFVFRYVSAKIRSNRADHIYTFEWPPGLTARLLKHHPSLTPHELDTVGDGLRQFFHAYSRSGYRYVSMPSQVADDLWHEFILYTRDYQRFCQKAFGRMLHHTPAVRLANAQSSGNEGLRRVWWHACKMEWIDPSTPHKLPLLFRLDAELKIANGFHYSRDCKALRDAGVASAVCGGDFASTAFDGGTAGFGADAGDATGASGSSGSDGASDGGGGCGGGGCGGGGGD
jgi:hypothetical protein